VFDVPLLATDLCGNFIKGAHGLPQVVMRTAGSDGLFNTADDGRRWSRATQRPRSTWRTRCARATSS
jgi:hypothetical protein